MKKKDLLFISMIPMFLTCSAWGEDLPWEMKLPFKEATIHYELSGAEKGKETLYIKDSGKFQAKHHSSTVTMMGTTKKTDTIQITDPDWVTTYDLVEKKGGKTTNPNKIYKNEYNKLSAEEKKNFEKNAKELGNTMVGQFGATVKQNSSKLLGYDCDVITMGGISTVHSMHGTGIPLRAETSVMGMNNVYTATKVDTSSAIPDSAFAPPAGIPVALDQNMESMTMSMIQDTVDTLKTPDGAQQMQQAGPLGMMGGKGMQQSMQKEMQEEGVSPEEQQEMMRQMNEAMQQMQKAKPLKK
jgi:hypothetical protein